MNRTSLALLVLGMSLPVLAGCAGFPMNTTEPLFQEKYGEFDYCKLEAVKQARETSCGTACLASVMNYWGVQISEEDLLAKLPELGEHGLSIKDMKTHRRRLWNGCLRLFHERRSRRSAQGANPQRPAGDMRHALPARMVLRLRCAGLRKYLQISRVDLRFPQEPLHCCLRHQGRRLPHHGSRPWLCRPQPQTPSPRLAATEIRGIAMYKRILTA